MKTIWVVSEGIFHPPIDGRFALRRALHGCGVQVKSCRQLEQLPQDMSDIAAIVLYIHRQSVEQGALRRLIDYVRNGGGMLAVHSASASFKRESAFFELLGGRFVGHGKIQRLKFRPLRVDLFDGIDDFTIKDELYRHEFQPKVEVHWLASAAGEETPAVWTYCFGAGRVCYLMPGHLGSSLRHPAVQEIIQRGLTWVMGRPQLNPT